jgi:hypothetical protein
MTRFVLSIDPGTAHPAKNAAAPGLPTKPMTDFSGRTPMVDTTPAPAAGSDRYGEVAALMGRKPERAVFPCTRDFDAARVAWLFKMADALENAELDDDSEQVRSTALGLVHGAVNEIAGADQ